MREDGKPRKAWVEVVRSVSSGNARIAEISSILGLVLMTLLVSTQVFLRYILGQALPWAEEAAVYLMVWMAFIGSAVALHQAEHIALGILVNRVSGVSSTAIRIGVNLVIILFLAMVAILGVQLAMAISGQRSPALGINMFWPYLILPLGCLLMMIEMITRLVLRLMPYESHERA